MKWMRWLANFINDNSGKLSLQKIIVPLYSISWSPPWTSHFFHNSFRRSTQLSYFGLGMYTYQIHYYLRLLLLYRGKLCNMVVLSKDDHYYQQALHLAYIQIKFDWLIYKNHFWFLSTVSYCFCCSERHFLSKTTSF